MKPNRYYNEVMTFQWKRPQRSRRFYQYIVLAGLVVGFLLVVVLQQNYQRQKNYWGWEPYRIGVYEGRGEGVRLSLVSYYPNDKSVEVFVFQNQDRLTAAGGYGQFTVKSLKDLDTQEKAKGKILTDTLAINLGMYLRGMVKEEKNKGSLPEINTVWAKHFLNKNFWTQPGSIAGLIDWIRIKYSFLDLGNKQVNATFLDKQKVWSNPAQSDGDLWLFDPTLFDRLVSVKSAAPVTEMPVTLINLTERPGLALSFSRILEREGYSVLRVESDKTGERAGQPSEIRVFDETDKNGEISRLKLISGIQRVNKTTEPDRIKAAIYLGDDFDLD